MQVRKINTWMAGHHTTPPAKRNMPMWHHEKILNLCRRATKQEKLNATSLWRSRCNGFCRLHRSTFLVPIVLFESHMHVPTHILSASIVRHLHKPRIDNKGADASAAPSCRCIPHPVPKSKLSGQQSTYHQWCSLTASVQGEYWRTTDAHGNSTSETSHPTLTQCPLLMLNLAPSPAAHTRHQSNTVATVLLSQPQQCYLLSHVQPLQNSHHHGIRSACAVAGRSETQV
ncbi:hypothetical protein IWX47DRAFT_114088 [Phyllosticta citricarpa]